MAYSATTKHLQTALSAATNSCHVCQDISIHLHLEHPPGFWWTASSPSALWHLQLYCNVGVCMMVHSNDITQPHLTPYPAVLLTSLFGVISQWNFCLPPCRYMYVVRVCKTIGRLPRNYIMLSMVVWKT